MGRHDNLRGKPNASAKMKRAVAKETTFVRGKAKQMIKRAKDDKKYPGK